MSTAQTPISPVLDTFTDAFTEVMREATEATRISARLYVKGLDVIVEQQKLAGTISRQWMSDLVSTQSDLSRELVRGIAGVTEAGAEAAAESADHVQSSAAEAAQPSRPTRAPSGRRQAARGRQTPRRAAAARAVAATSEADAPAWNSEGYDSLTAAELNERLPGYSQRELGQAEIHERAHEARQTVLTRIESLRGVEPVAGYDELTVPEVQARITDADAAFATSVREYEQRHKKRDGVLNAVRARIEKAE